MFIPSMLLKRLYTFGSLKNTANGVTFSIKNRLSDTELSTVHSIKIDGKAIALDKVTMVVGDGRSVTR